MELPIPADAYRGRAAGLQIRAQRRRSWWSYSSAFVLVPLAFAGGFMLLTRLDSDPPMYGQIGLFDPLSLVFLAAGVVALVSVIIAVPWFFTEQEMVVDSVGVLFKQQPMWWFSGRRALVPWSSVKSIATGYLITEGTAMTPVSRMFYNSAPDEPRTFIEFTLRSAPQARLPSWVELTPARERGNLPTLRLGPDQLPHQVEQLLRRYRPDLFRTP